MPDFCTINEVLGNADANCEAAEAHGLLCGIICAAGKQAEKSWLAEVLPAGRESAQPGHDSDILHELFAQTLRGLDEGQMEFMPLLPADNESLDRRTECLGKWCAGFLDGMGLGGLGDVRDRLPETVIEVMADLEQLAQAVSGDQDEEEEAAFTEVLEYLRVSVQLIYEELPGLRGHEVEQLSRH